MNQKIKALNNTTGIYKIYNSLNNKVYIGSSRNIGRRLYAHWNLLKNKNHHSKKLQDDWDLFGEDNFNIEVLEVCVADELLQKEQTFINLFNSYKNGYNSTNSYSPQSNQQSEDQLQFIIKFSKQKDATIFNIINNCQNRILFIKNAIYYYIVAIERGEVIDRHYPYHGRLVRHLKENRFKRTLKIGS